MSLRLLLRRLSTRNCLTRESQPESGPVAIFVARPFAVALLPLAVSQPNRASVKLNRRPTRSSVSFQVDLKSKEKNDCLICFIVHDRQGLSIDFATQTRETNEPQKKQNTDSLFQK
jgi:hypothetical protein